MSKLQTRSEKDSPDVLPLSRKKSIVQVIGTVKGDGGNDDFSFQAKTYLTMHVNKIQKLSKFSSCLQAKIFPGFCGNTNSEVQSAYAGGLNEVPSRQVEI